MSSVGVLVRVAGMTCEIGARVAALLMAATAVAGAQPAADALLQRPASAGMLALLGSQLDDPQISSVFRAALQHSDPRVRAAAGRVAAGQPHPTLLAALNVALGQETDFEAALEESHAILSATGGNAFRGELEAAARLAPENLDAFVEAVALHRRTAFQETLRAVRELSPNAASLLRFISIGSGGRPDVLHSLNLQAIDQKDALLATTLFAAWSETRQSLPKDLAERGFASNSLEVRASACWLLAGPLAREQGSLPSPPVDFDAGSIEVAFGCELGRRATGETPRQAAELIERLNDDATELHWPVLVDVLPRLRNVFHLLTQAERGALSRRLLGTPDALKASAETSSPVEPSGEFQVVRLLGGYPKGFVEDVMNVAGCAEGKAPELAGGSVEFGEEGRPRRVAPLGASTSECMMAVRALLMAARLPAKRVTAAQRALMLLPLTRDVWKCLSENRTSSRARKPSPASIRDETKQPTKIRDVRPQYPLVAQEQGLQGAVIVEAVISPTGCVAEADLARSVGTPLDVHAVAAVSQWRYTPTLLNGVAVPVIMTVTVNFALK